MVMWLDLRQPPARGKTSLWSRILLKVGSLLPHVASAAVSVPSEHQRRRPHTSSHIYCPAAPDRPDTCVLNSTFRHGADSELRLLALRSVAVGKSGPITEVCSCALHVHCTFPPRRSARASDIFVPFPPLVDGGRTALLLICLLALRSPSSSPKTDLISMSRRMANVISRFCLAIAIAASVATAKRAYLNQSLWRGCFHFVCFFPTGFETAALSKLWLPLFIWPTK